MNKKVIIIIITFLIAFLPSKINAVDICNTTRYDTLKKEAYQIKFNYELKFDKDHNPYFELTAYNVSPNVIIIFDGNEYVGDGNNQIKFINAFESGKKYEMKMYGGVDTPCAEQYIYKRTIEFPKYNSYSERDECIEYEEFPLCNKWYKGEIPDDSYFLEKFQEYKKSLEKEEKKEKVIEEKSIIDQIIDFYVNNLIITVPLTILFVLVIIAIIIRKIIRKKKRVKLEF